MASVMKVQSMQWTVELIGVVGLIGAAGMLLGLVLAQWWGARRLAQAYSQLQQAEAAKQHVQAELQEQRLVLHERQLEHSKLELLLSHAQTGEQRVQAQLDEALHDFQGQRVHLEQWRQQFHTVQTQYETSRAENQTLQTQAQELRQQLERLQHQHHELVAQHNTLDKNYASLLAEQQEKLASHARELASFERQKASLTEQFKALSNDILEAKSRSLQESSQQSLNALMGPFQQSIDNFKKEVREIHHRETSQQGELRKELANLKELNQRITTEAHELSTALRGQKKLQGNWGELVLENVLDRAGLQQGRDYEREVSFNTEQGRQRPDAIVYLPQEKHLIIDAKVSLNAYTRYVNAENELERSQALREHVQAVAARIKELGDRDYYRLPGLNSPEMVFMFIPIESAFVEALKADESLFQQAIESHVLVATPTTLLTSLNIVRQLWRYEDQNKHTAALAHKAEAVFKKLNSFLVSFERIKKGLDAANEAYGRAENQLLSGRGNLVKQVAEFKNLAPAIRAELPTYFLEKAALEVDFSTPDEPDASVNVGAKQEPLGE